MTNHDKRNAVAIGTSDATGATLNINLRELIVSRLLIQATSGGGKSYLVRRLLEQTHGRTQHIVIDVEGEFATLRERFDYVYGAKEGGDTTVDPRGAALLAERLLELKVSAILDLSELKHHDRLTFVHRFLDAMVEAPRRLWHPCMVVVDEAHYFCPQGDDVESSESVMALATKGRKRGFCIVLATQRLSKLHKDAAAECLNRFIGRTSLDLDMKRAADELGFSSREQRLTLRKMQPGQFYAFGPAVSAEVVKMKGGAVLTTHPKAGGRIRFVPPKPTRRIRALLPKLADLPHEESKKAATERELRRQLVDAKLNVARLEKSTAPRTVPILTPAALQRIRQLQLGIVAGLFSIEKMTAGLKSALATLDIEVRKDGTVTRTTQQAVDVSKLSSTMRVLAAIKAFPGSEPRRIGNVSGVRSGVSTFRLAIVELRKKGYIRGDYQQGFTLTVDGERAAAHLPVPTTGAEAVEQWRRQLGRGVARQLFDAAYAAGERGITAEDIEHDTGIDTSVSTFRLAVTHLKHRNLLTGNRQRFFITKDLL